MNIENQIVLVQEKLKSLKSDYTSEVNELTSSPKCYLKRHLKMSSLEEKCLNSYPNEFLKGLTKTVQLAIVNDWGINIDLGNEISFRENREATSINYGVSHNFKTKETKISIKKEVNVIIKEDKKPEQ